MKNKKNIEQIFQEKLKDFEVNPPKESWDFISEKINEKEEKKRVVPIFWWKSAAIISSVAAVLMIGFILFNYQNNGSFLINSTGNTNKISKNQAQRNASENVTKSIDIDSSSSQIVNKNHSTITSGSTNVKTNDLGINKNYLVEKQQLINKTRNLIQSPHNQSYKAENNIEKQIVEEKKIVENNASNTSEKISTEKAKDESPSQILAENKPENIENKDKISLDEKEEEIFAENKSQEELKEQTEKIKKNNSRKISVFASYAPVFGNSTKGSAINDSFDKNSKTFGNNNSFGAGIKVAFNDKISVRTGVNNYSLNHSTENVVFYRTRSVVTVGNINGYGTLALNEIGRNIVIVNDNMSPNGADVVGAVNSGTLNQEMSFIEIPVEFSYNLLNKKLKINSITGFSSVILNKNAVSISANNEKTEIGKSSNINNLHFTGNFGLGFSYPFSKNVEINLEPTFKYHFNTFKDKQNSFSPYFIGIYTGFVYKF